MKLFFALIIIPYIAISGPAQSQEDQWRALDPDNTVYLQTPDGRAVIELNPVFAPKTSAQFKKLVKEKFYDGLSFYRVIDGFVAQGGDESDESEEMPNPTLPAEFERDWSDDMSFVRAQKDDLFAPETGFIDSFPAARDMEARKVWLTHCPGTVAMARNNAADSGSTDYYIVIGQAPRYLDRNLTVFGRVVMGMNVVQNIKRGPTANNGIIEDKSQRTPMTALTLAADSPPEQRLDIKIMDSNSQAFKDTLESRRNRDHEFFHHKPPQVLDVCQVPIAIKE